MTKLRFAALFEDAAALWRTNRDLLLAIAGVFYLLPILALLMFVPAPRLAGLQPDAQRDAILAWAANWPWFLIGSAVQLIGTVAILTLLLTPGRISLRDALILAVRRIVPLFGLWSMVSLVCFAGFFPLVIPGLYLLGRTFLAIPISVAERSRLFPAFVASIERTRGHGWMIAAAYMTVFLANFMVSNLLAPLLDAAGAGSPVLSGVVLVLVAGAGALAALATTLVQASAYRGLTRQGM
ncbi:hypothetical protein TPR58_19180 [Sphingomonas sp. HF-S3]|uniref:Glycerophosphoryl diester phosphodiesterase membrane domain-containing protein n=1 Tax=Sphingomonas rustica TaxID=3103142 RepID=A0ABV0BGU4_9SPHN